MKIVILGLASGVALFAVSAPPAALGQMMYNYPIITVPPPADIYASPKPIPKPAPDKSKASDKPEEPAQAPAYQGRTRLER